MDKKDFGARLLALRKQKGVSQAEVAGYIGLTVAASTAAAKHLM